MSLSKSATADLDAQARNPYSLSWLWIPGSFASLTPRNDASDSGHPSPRKERGEGDNHNPSTALVMMLRWISLEPP
jgi:hypothetical protein